VQLRDVYVRLLESVSVCLPACLSLCVHLRVRVRVCVRVHVRVRVRVRVCVPVYIFLCLYIKTGARMQSTQLRAGSVVRKDFVDFYDFKQSGAFEPPSSATGVTLQKGDSFLVECWWVCVCVCVWGGVSVCVCGNLYPLPLV